MARMFFISGYLNLADDDEASQLSFEEIDKAVRTEEVIGINQLDDVVFEER